jgi:putative PIN family toxin of toxin-antitoxin system
MVMHNSPEDRQPWPAHPRVVIDTNVLVGGAYAPTSASRQIIDACLRSELVAVLSPALRKEYEHILERAVRVRGYDEKLHQFLEQAEAVEPAEVPRVVPDDPEDDKLVAAALGANAGYIITNDHHLLGLDTFEGIRIVRPADFIRFWSRG